MNNDFVLFFRHIPKTGGTSILHHFRKHLGKDATVNYGLHSRRTRFFKDQPQLEEMTEEQRRKIRFVQGHGVDENSLAHIPATDRKLMVILREPVALTRSRFNQRCVEANRLGRTVNEARFLKRDASNVQARQLIKFFPGFADDPDADDLAKALSILRKFDFVFTLELLNVQSAGLMDLLGMDREIKRRRVADKKVTLNASDEDLASINRIDSEIVRACNHVDDAALEVHNPLGFDAEGKERAIRRLTEDAAGAAFDRETVYRQLALSLCRELLAEAAMRKIEAMKDAVAIEDPDRLYDILQTEWNAQKDGLDAAKLKRSHAKSLRWEKIYRGLEGHAEE